MKDIGKLRWALGLCAVLGVAALGVACDDDDEVIPGVDASADTGAADTGNDAPKDVRSVDFGTVCAGIADCGGATNYCAKSPPTAATGQCTYYGCNLKPGVCPASDPCTDVSMYLAGVPANTFLCVNPAKLKPPGDGGTDAGGDAGSDSGADAQ